MVKPGVTVKPDGTFLAPLDRLKSKSFFSQRYRNTLLIASAEVHFLHCLKVQCLSFLISFLQTNASHPTQVHSKWTVVKEEEKNSLSDSIISLAVFQCVDTFQHLARVVREDKTSTLRTVSVKFPSCSMIAAGGEHRQCVSLKKSFCLISQAARPLPACHPERIC